MKAITVRELLYLLELKTSELRSLRMSEDQVSFDKEIKSDYVFCQNLRTDLKDIEIIVDKIYTLLGHCSK